MSRQRSAVKPSEYEQVAKKQKKKLRSSTPDVIKQRKLLRYATVKEDQYRGLRVVLTQTFGLV